MKFLSRLFAETAIRIHQGRITCLKGKIMSRIMHDLTSLAAEHGVTHGEIWIDAMGKIKTSREIPESLHQRIRNILLS